MSSSGEQRIPGSGPKTGCTYEETGFGGYGSAAEGGQHQCLPSHPSNDRSSSPHRSPTTWAGLVREAFECGTARLSRPVSEGHSLVHSVATFTASRSSASAIFRSVPRLGIEAELKKRDNEG